MKFIQFKTILVDWLFSLLSDHDGLVFQQVHRIKIRGTENFPSL